MTEKNSDIDDELAGLIGSELASKLSDSKARRATGEQSTIARNPAAPLPPGPSGNAMPMADRGPIPIPMPVPNLAPAPATPVAPSTPAPTNVADAAADPGAPFPAAGKTLQGTFPSEAQGIDTLRSSPDALAAFAAEPTPISHNDTPVAALASAENFAAAALDQGVVQEGGVENDVLAAYGMQWEAGAAADTEERPDGDGAAEISDDGEPSADEPIEKPFDTEHHPAPPRGFDVADSMSDEPTGHPSRDYDHKNDGNEIDGLVVGFPTGELRAFGAALRKFMLRGPLLHRLGLLAPLVLLLGLLVWRLLPAHGQPPQAFLQEAASLRQAADGPKGMALYRGAEVTVLQQDEAHAVVVTALGQAGYLPINALGPLLPMLSPDDGFMGCAIAEGEEGGDLCEQRAASERDLCLRQCANDACATQCKIRFNDCKSSCEPPEPEPEPEPDSQPEPIDKLSAAAATADDDAIEEATAGKRKQWAKKKKRKGRRGKR